MQNRKFLYVICLLTLSAPLVLAGGKIKGNNKYGFIYQAKRLFGASSYKRVATMSQQEKDKELQFYAEKEVPHPSFLLGKLTFPNFDPLKKNLNEIIHLVRYGASVNLDIPYHWAHKVSGQGTFKPIYLFISTNDIKNTQLLLERGAKVDEPILQERISDASSQVHPLFFAHTKEMAELLISYGADISQCKNYHYLCGAYGKRGGLLQTMIDTKYDAELIPLYFAQLEVDDKQKQAERMITELVENKNRYQTEHKQEQYDKKMKYLKQAGAQIDPIWG